MREIPPIKDYFTQPRQNPAVKTVQTASKSNCQVKLPTQLPKEIVIPKTPVKQERECTPKGISNT